MKNDDGIVNETDRWTRDARLQHYKWRKQNGRDYHIEGTTHEPTDQ